MKAKNIEGSVYDTGHGELQVWGVNFTISGSLYRDASGRIPESARNRIMKRIKKILSEVEFSDEEINSSND